ncbi:MAG: histidine kinase, partial [Phaeodactylibacter sp.]|nr:histidine kinase [Phaeodactylibacter sp.]
MESIKRTAEHFLLSNTAWIFFTVILFLSYVMMVESGQYTRAYYGAYVVSTAILFAPVLAFAAYRRRLKEELGRYAYLALWGIIFVVYPVMVAVGQAFRAESLFLFPPEGEAVPAGFVEVVGAGLFLTEVAIHANDYLLRRAGGFRQLGLRKSLLLLAAGGAALLGMAFAYRPFTAAFPDSFFGFLQKAPLFFGYTLQFLLMILAYSFFYFVNHYFLVPRLLKEKGVLFYGFGAAGAVLVFYPVVALLLSWLPVVRAEELLSYPASEIFPSDRGGLPFAVMLLSAPLIVGMEWYKQAGKLASLEKERTAAELALLKQQVNPHFFFNTLNNLYALSITRDKQTPEVILQLSELMRYVIYNGREESAALAEEVKYIEDYIRLQQIRLHKHLDFRFEKDIADEKLRIPPLLFIILVENAFKHGIEPAEEACSLHL